ncbi:MAG: L-glutamate gamma-semialdehyde dehydrogenase [Bdellovibrionales bacterium]|nr:L-glutamate gamma-semialdehyde dehydrogenase [Bdellovibrionales bacterium]
MSNALIDVSSPQNEPVLAYRPGSKERKEIELVLASLQSQKIEIPMVIGGKKVVSDQKVSIHPPHQKDHVLGYFYKGNKEHVQQAITEAMRAKHAWERLDWKSRASIFLKAADLVAGKYRAQINAATMLGQSKNVYQAEIDAACEFADFLRFNVAFMCDMYKGQPSSSDGVWNTMEYRPLEGFVFALTPFNFTSIAANLGAAPALLGNTVVWKPAETQIYSAKVIMDIFEEAGLPQGVINLVFVDGPEAGEVIFSHPDFAGLHFTGSTKVFQHLWKEIGANIGKYKSYPRIVGETGGKDFIVAHPSANKDQLITALTRAAFEFQGQKCSACSRAYIPQSLWEDVKAGLVRDVESMKMGSPLDFTNFINAVIDQKSFDKILNYIEKAKQSSDALIVVGGQADSSQGYFIQPTVIQTTNPHFVTMEEEIFGPVLTVYVYQDQDFEKTLQLVDQTSPYALTGSIFAKQPEAIEKAKDVLRHAAGNFYINDKPTGAVVGQQPFGGARGSGTNDKAGSVLNLYRWVSARTIKETFCAPTDYRYPFMEN